MSEHIINTVEALVEHMGEANDFVKSKVVAELEPEMESFIASSTLVLISTLDAQGNPDISPKGDPAGFVYVESPTQLHIPDRPGNKLVMGFRNLLDNSSIGLLFVTPNSRETLRVKGKATLSKDPALLERLSAKGKPALLATSVEIEECFFHCGKAMIRSGMWQPDTWPERASSIIAKQAARKLDVETKVIEDALEENYRDELY